MSCRRYETTLLIDTPVDTNPTRPRHDTTSDTPQPAPLTTGAPPPYPTPMARQRRYTDEDKQRALAELEANGGNTKRTARLLGIPRTTILQWRDGVTNRVDTKAPGRGLRVTRPVVLRQESRVSLADACEE